MWNQFKTIALLGALSALVVGVGGALAPNSLGLFVVLAAFLNLGAYFFSHKLVLAMSRARPLGAGELPWLQQTVAELARNAGIPTPRLYLVPEAQPNAFATGRNPKHGVVAVTAGILELLSERELRGVLAHEIAHIKNRDILISSVAAMLASVLTYLANILSFTGLFGGSRDTEEGSSGTSNLLFILAAPLAATLIQLGISRSREYLADDTGAQISGDPEGLARALAKLQRTAQVIPADVQPATASLYIVNPFAGGGALLHLLSTHPPMEKRIARLLEQAQGRGATFGRQAA